MFNKIIKTLFWIKSKEEIPAETLKHETHGFECDAFDPANYIQDPERLETFRNMPDGALKDSAIRYLRAGCDPEKVMLTVEDIDKYFLE